ncbi:MAG: transcription antitermination factor NusB [Oscillospiraceae bacterium]
MKRQDIRDCAFKIVFESLLRDDSLEELYEIAEDIDEITVNDKVKEMVEGTLRNAEMIDEVIQKFSTKRSVDRIAKINLAILRIAFYEIMFDDLTPTNAAISEAVHLSETYSHEQDTAFVNGVLGAYAKSLEENKE